MSVLVDSRRKDNKFAGFFSNFARRMKGNRQSIFSRLPGTALLLAGLLAVFPAFADSDSRLDEEIALFSRRAVRAVSPDSLFLMKWEVNENGDTIFTEELRPARVFARQPRQKGREWRKYYKLVFNFNKVYPYALVGRNMMAQVDSTLAAEPLKRSERSQYIKSVEKELFRLFEKDIRKMTISQGMVLLRLVDRECGMPPYDIIKTYEGSFAAGFWQFVAKLFDADLKKRYDPEDKDRQIEELVGIWDSGDWDAFYWSIFWENPPRTVISAQRLSSQVKKKKR